MGRRRRRKSGDFVAPAPTRQPPGPAPRPRAEVAASVVAARFVLLAAGGRRRRRAWPASRGAGPADTTCSATAVRTRSGPRSAPCCPQAPDLVRGRRSASSPRWTRWRARRSPRRSSSARPGCARSVGWGRRPAARPGRGRARRGAGRRACRRPRVAPTAMSSDVGRGRDGRGHAPVDDRARAGIPPLAGSSARPARSRHDRRDHRPGCVLGFGRYLVQASAFGGGDRQHVQLGELQRRTSSSRPRRGGALAGARAAAGTARREAPGWRTSTRSRRPRWVDFMLAVLAPLGVLLAALAGLIAAVWPTCWTRSATCWQYFVTVFAVQVPLYGVAVLLYACCRRTRSFKAFAPGDVRRHRRVRDLRAPSRAASATTRRRPATRRLLSGTTAGVAVMALPMFWPVHRLARGCARMPASCPGSHAQFVALAPRVGSLVAQQAHARRHARRRGRGDGNLLAVLVWSQQVYLLPYAVLVGRAARRRPCSRGSWPSSDRRSGEYASMASATTRAAVAAPGSGRSCGSWSRWLRRRGRARRVPSGRTARASRRWRPRSR